MLPCPMPLGAMPFNVPFIRFAEQCQWAAGFVWGPRRLYDHEVVYVLSGQLHVHLGDSEFVATADQAFLVPPRLVQVFRAGDGPEPQNHFGIHFDWVPRDDSNDFSLYNGSYGLLMDHAHEPFFREPQVIPGWDSAVTPVLDLRGRPRVRALLHELVTARSVGGEYMMWQSGALLAAAIAQLAHEADLLRDIATNPHLGPDAIRRVQRARELLEAPHPQPLSVGEVAAQVGWSADHLGRMCREVLGASPYRIQTTVRLNRAREMLRRRTFSIAQVAYQCGFKDVSHFMSTFKRETGVTAKQFMELGVGEPQE